MEKLKFNVGDPVLIYEEAPNNGGVSIVKSCIIKITNTGNYKVTDGRIFSKYGDRREDCSNGRYVHIVPFNQEVWDAQVIKETCQRLRKDLHFLQWSKVPDVEILELQDLIQKYGG